jgi:phthalate 4,5-dioxygenase
MLRKEQNDLVTQTGPGTPMGKLFRLYWHPILNASELPEPDCPPVRVKILSERLLAFRDTSGKIGLVDEFCAHRGVSLWFGRNEENGIRCPYHGWKYDRDGNCTEVPSEPAESGFCQKVKLNSYPCIEKGGIVWTYMGPADQRPPEPSWEFITLPENQQVSKRRLSECNWLQALEGGIDSSHVSFLHRGDLSSDPLFKGANRANNYNMTDMKPVFEVVEHPGGLYVGARRNAEDDQYYWRITQWVMPAFTMVPPRADHPLHGHFWVPIDDETCWAWSYLYHPTRPLHDYELQAAKDGRGTFVKYTPGTLRPLANKDNDYLIDRVGQKAGKTFSGVEGIAMQDQSLQESMGPVVDRTKENLVGTDNGIIMARHRLMRAAKALDEKGTLPPGRDPVHQQIRSIAVVLPRSEPYKDAAAELCRSAPGKKHQTV